MVQEVDIKILPEKLSNESYIRNLLISRHLEHGDELTGYQLIKKSIDARGREPLYLLRYRLFIDEMMPTSEAYDFILPNIEKSKKIAIIGAGPAGYFAALELIQLGLRPIVFDRGTDVQSRRKDLRAIQQFGIVNPDSNYCFGEGGAGTYSDGKLYTRAKKRGDIDKILAILVAHGASDEIMIESHPHIGSNKLPKILANIRNSIINAGGEVHFNHKLTDIDIDKGEIKKLIFANGREDNFDHVILATGHSARDIYELLFNKGVTIEAKPFALGVRVEHPQMLIDSIQYNKEQRGDFLPAASYSLTCQVKNEGVFSFCMCPGGLIVPAATAPGEIVVNGMSLSKRDSPFANSGVVVSVNPSAMDNFKKFGVFAGVEFQRNVEQTLFNHGDGSQKAPAQRLEDFTKGKLSKDLNDSSYIPGLYSAPLHELLPNYVYNHLKEGLKLFGNKMRGYYTNEANVVGTESRTSSPVKIPRNDKDLMHPDLKGLYPCGEGAGYAGGIMSAALDGQRVAKAIKQIINN